MGTVRWARLYDEGLAGLRISDPEIALQWKLLIEIMHEQGDLGLTSVDSNLIYAWSRYEEARSHLESILGNVRQPALENLRARLHAKYRKHGAREALADTHYFGRREVQPYKRDQSSVRTAIRVPAQIDHPTIRLMFFVAEAGRPVFAVEVGVWGSQRRDDEGEPRFKIAGGKLTKVGFKSAAYNGESVFWREHEAPSFLDSSDVPARLLSLIDEDFGAIVDSGLLASEFELTFTRGRNSPKKVRK